MKIPVAITSFAIDPQTSLPMVVLCEKDGRRSIAVPVDLNTAKLVALTSLAQGAAFPGAIELLHNVIARFGGAFERSVIDGIEDGAFTARVIIKTRDGCEHAVASPPCEAVVLALRCGAEIFVEEEVFIKLHGNDGQSDDDALRERIRSVDVSEFGKYVFSEGKQ